MAHTAFRFDLHHRDAATAARRGAFRTPRGAVDTPAFMPVGTLGTVKAVPQQWLREALDAPIILGNTYHLFLRPGVEVLEAAGGLHAFMGWDRPILTDSGGYQVYSLAHRRKITPEGVQFQSHIDGSTVFFTPENVVDTQRSIGSDIQMVLDECPPYPAERSYAEQSMHLTHAWAKRAQLRFRETEARYGVPGVQFGIVQGSTYPDLRRISAEAISELDFFGNALGGLSVGEPTPELYDLVEHGCGLLPPTKPRYVMGVGTPADLLNVIARGTDMFDCVLPTRNARHGKLYFWDGHRNLKAAKWAQDFSALDGTSTASFDTDYSKAYLRHLLRTDEYLGLSIASAHNLHFFLRLVREARERILAGSFAGWWRQTAQQVAVSH